MRRAFADPKQLACLLRAKILPPRSGPVKFFQIFLGAFCAARTVEPITSLCYTWPHLPEVTSLQTKDPDARGNPYPERARPHDLRASSALRVAAQDERPTRRSALALLRAFLVGMGELLGVPVSAASESVGRSLSRSVLSGLLAEVLPSQMAWRTTDGDAYTAFDLRRHIELGDELASSTPRTSAHLPRLAIRTG